MFPLGNMLPAPCGLSGPAVFVYSEIKILENNFVWSFHDAGYALKSSWAVSCVKMKTKSVSITLKPNPLEPKITNKLHNKFPA